MKLLLLVINAVLLSMASGGQCLHAQKPGFTCRQNSPIKKQQSHQKKILLAGVLPKDANRAYAVLRKAGISFESAGSRGVGIWVPAKDFAHAKRVLTADAKQLHYQVTFANRN